MREKISHTLSNNIEKYLNEKRITQSQLAARIKVNKSTLHGYLNGVVPNSIISLKKIANLLEVSLDELLFNEKTQRYDHKATSEERFEIIIRKVD